MKAEMFVWSFILGAALKNFTYFFFLGMLTAGPFEKFCINGQL